ncbi:MAG: cbb3-type cytochrome c oxidase subunit II, partial [Proteobacteria bacterium]|nr:cbb3-type cytochrome c oxidase subunit II [Pseudomonadota bacterium]
EAIDSRVGAMVTLGVPYDDKTVAAAGRIAAEQAKAIATTIEAGGGPKGLADKKVIALVAYLQRLGVDFMHAKDGAK